MYLYFFDAPNVAGRDGFVEQCDQHTPPIRCFKEHNGCGVIFEWYAADSAETYPNFLGMGGARYVRLAGSLEIRAPEATAWTPGPELAELGKQLFGQP